MRKNGFTSGISVARIDFTHTGKTKVSHSSHKLHETFYIS
ncbi:hypothetical protein HMPREF9244_01465 [Alloscardovia omnicolens F0580]|uniref:Uncharacterized protein n=1 Tax=Alloscardovia omnicolens F0580 TaxID=1321816 RepID=U1R758_9BIFI|nr:hypothetical protein HMPREF9244_01465 [Alloscardovia omnicolens F0580]